MFTFRPAAPGAIAPRLILASLLFLGSASLASAQTLTLRGAVEDEPSGFVLNCTPVQLVSSAVNLNDFLGEEVVATGTVIGPNLVSVATVATVTDVLEVNKNAAVGGEMKLSVTGPVAQSVQIYFALGNGFAPIQSMGWFLNTASTRLLLAGMIPAPGKLEVTINVPNLAVLANLELFFQVVRLTPGGGFTLGNADCVTIQP